MRMKEIPQSEWLAADAYLVNLIKRKGGSGEWRKVQHTQGDEISYTIEVEDLGVMVDGGNVLSVLNALEKKLDELPDVGPEVVRALHKKIDNAIELVDSVNGLIADRLEGSENDSVKAEEISKVLTRVKQELMGEVLP